MSKKITKSKRVFASILFFGMTLMAQASDMVEHSEQPVTNLGNQIGYCGREIAESINHLGNCLFFGACVIAVALILRRRQKKE